MVSEKCNSQHKHDGQRCNRAKGHEGACRSKVERHGDMLLYSEWMSRNGEFHYNIGYKVICPKNLALSREVWHD